MLCVISHTNDCIIYWCCLSSSGRILFLDNIGLHDTHCHAGWQAVNHPSLCSILPDGKPKPQSMVWDPCDWFVGPNVTCLIQIQSPGSPVRNTQQSNDPETLQSLAWIKAKETNYWLDIFNVVQAKFQQGNSNDGIYHKAWMRWKLYWLIYLWIVCTTRLRPTVFAFKQ